MSAIDSIKQQMNQIYHEKRVNETKKSEKDTLKDEILGVISKALDNKDAKTPAPTPTSSLPV